jgi:Tol biopolymer transport system component
MHNRVIERALRLLAPLVVLATLVPPATAHALPPTAVAAPTHELGPETAISGNGRIVVYAEAHQTGPTSGSYRNRAADRWTGADLHVTPEDGDASYGAGVSGDGRFVASDLWAGDAGEQVFVSDLAAGENSMVSLAMNGNPGNSYSDLAAISADGRYVSFQSYATDLVPGDTNDTEDVFVRDLRDGITQRVSVSTAGEEGERYRFSSRSALSADGRYCAFESSAGNLVSGDTNDNLDVFVRDLRSGVTRRISVGTHGEQADGYSEDPAISSDGRYVAFVSTAPNLVPGDTNDKADVFVRDLRSGVTRRVSVGSHGEQADGYSDDSAISGDGRYVVFVSSASNLVPNDTNGSGDVFIRDRVLGTTRRVDVGPGNEQADRSAYGAAVSSDGRYVSFISGAMNLVPGDDNEALDVFVRDRWRHTTRRVNRQP